LFQDHNYCKASTEFVPGSIDLPFIPPGKLFEKDYGGRAADNIRNF